MNATTVTLRTLGQIRVTVRNAAAGLSDRRVARKVVTTAMKRKRLRNDADIQLRIEATVVADEWKRIADERKRRAVA